MLRNLDWLHDLTIAWDSSTFDTDPFEPQADGAGTIFPFWVRSPAEVGRPGAARAIGRANATNPICVIVPCHRVIRSDGSLTGFAYGTTIKRQLLELEGALPPALL